MSNLEWAVVVGIFAIGYAVYRLEVQAQRQTDVLVQIREMLNRQLVVLEVIRTGVSRSKD
jgi:prolipoprotein diacylglyceryltransferase